MTEDEQRAFAVAVGAALWEGRIDLGWSMSQVADRAGMSRSQGRR